MNVYLLDKNVVEDIRLHIRSDKQINSQAITFAKKIDRAGNIVSPILSILEGGFQRPLTSAQLHDNLFRDSIVVEMFYQHARTDTSVLHNSAASFASIFSPHHREKTEKLIPFALRAQKMLARTYSVRDARKVLDEIISMSIEHELGTAHPLTFCAIACLYGNSAARKVLKPSENPVKPEAYNPVVDIRLLMETAYIKHLWRASSPGDRVHLHTRDGNLRELGNHLNITATPGRSLDPGTILTSFTSTPGDDIFTELKQKPKELAYVKQRILAGRLHKE